MTVSVDAADAALPGRTIVTEGWLARSRRFEADVVVDARGWGSLRPNDFNTNRNVTLIDVPDDGHPEFRRWAATRLKTYASYGWPIDPSGTETATP